MPLVYATTAIVLVVAHASDLRAADVVIDPMERVGERDLEGQR